ncbi:MAG: FAD-dependent oxidoreductase [Deltaproteobacteria bacterium]|nr:FAD-dependent oxidoreductase [Deltaproteobacteria bacterium]
MAPTPFPLLFSPISIKGLLLKNRIVMPPMCTSFATVGGVVTDRLIGYYQARAEGGVGLINIEFSYIHPTGKVFEHMLGIYDDRLIPGLRRLAQSIQQQGAKVIIQISHAGRRTHSDVIGCLPVAPSPIPRLNGETPRELSLPDIEEMIHDYIQAARRAKEAGFDGVMIHMAHGYLIQQFLSPLSNQRMDRYGGDWGGRSRFAVEILKGIRQDVGNDYPVTCRICGDEFLRGGIDLQSAGQLSRLLEANGIDAIEVSAGTHETPQVMSAPPYFPMGFLAHLAGGIKKEVNIPVGSVGRIHDPRLAEALLEQGKSDLIAVGRALIADPEWPNKAYRGRIDDICPCISCNQGCNDRMYYQQDISCTVNPGVGREITFALTPARKKKKVLILGGGPAGLETARIAAMRGHRVSLYEKEKELGGQLRIASAPPAKEDHEKLRKFFLREVERLGVKVRYGKFDKKTIAKLSPDFIVVAVGGKPMELEGYGFRDGKVISAWEVLSGQKPVGKRVVIIGGGQVGLETADFLLNQGKEIIILEMLKRLGQDMSPRARKMVLERLSQMGVEILTEAKAMLVKEDGVVFNRAGVVDQVRGVDSVIVAVGTARQEVGIRGLEKMGLPLRWIGDCSVPRKAFEAIHEGFLVGMEI